MTSAEFREWRRALGLTQRAAAAALGLSVKMIKLYERGAEYSRRDADGEPRAVVVPRAVELACLYLSYQQETKMNTYKFALLQRGGPIYGVGDSLETAREDAREWLDAETDLDEIKDYESLSASARAGGNNPLVIVPCTPQLARQVAEHGGQVRYEENSDGLVDVPR